MPSVDAYGIGIVGAGSIVEAAHLPAYRALGLRVEAIYDQNLERSSALARRFGIPAICRDLDTMLGDDSIAVIDVAVPPKSQPKIAKAVIRAGKHLLCQKPLACLIADAEHLVIAAEQRGVVLAVNSNMRWEPVIRRTLDAVSAGRLGELRSGEFVVRYHEKWSSWSWLVDSPRLLILFDTIHVLDVTRKLFGEPSVLSASYGRTAAGLLGETWVDLNLTYPSGAQVVISEDSQCPAESTLARFRLQGSAASIEGTFGIYYDYPVGRADTFRLVPRDRAEDSIPMEKLPDRWIPDAFGFTMTELLSAIEDGRPPSHSGRDHLDTLRLIDRIYQEPKDG
jgi:predicted dehydrogenase